MPLCQICESPWIFLQLMKDLFDLYMLMPDQYILRTFDKHQLSKKWQKCLNTNNICLKDQLVSQANNKINGCSYPAPTSFHPWTFHLQVQAVRVHWSGLLNMQLKQQFFYTQEFWKTHCSFFNSLKAELESWDVILYDS